MITFRDFLYLNTNMLNNYLSTIEGYSLEEFDIVESETGKKGGKLGYSPIVEGNASKETLRETKSKRVITLPAQFQKLFETLENLGQLKHIDLLDDMLWADIQKGEILEIQSKIRIPSFIQQVEQIQGFSPMLELMKTIGPDNVKETDIAMLEGINEVQKIAELKPIPIIIQTVSTSKFTFIADLSREYITGKIADFHGEAMVFGKVQRIIVKGQKYEAFSFIPDIQSLPNMNRKQRLAIKSNKNNKAKDTYSEIIDGPAIILSPLAIYR